MEGEEPVADAASNIEIATSAQCQHWRLTRYRTADPVGHCDKALEQLGFRASHHLVARLGAVLTKRRNGQQPGS